MIYSHANPILMKKAISVVGETFSNMGYGKPLYDYLQEILRRFKLYMGNLVVGEGNMIYTKGIAIYMHGGNGSLPDFKARLINKKIKTGLYITFGTNSIEYIKVIAE